MDFPLMFTHGVTLVVEARVPTAFETFLTYFGAILAAVLGITQLARWYFEKPKLKVTAHLNYTRLEQGELPAKGVLHEVAERGGRVEVLVEIRVANAGKTPIEILGLGPVLSQEPQMYKVVPSDFPVVLAPYTSIRVLLQPGWFQMWPIWAFGVVDAVGGLHLIARGAFEAICSDVEKLPRDIRQGLDRFEKKDSCGFIALDNVEKVDFVIEQLSRRWRKHYRRLLVNK